MARTAMEAAIQDEHEEELRALAEKLGGGWRFEHGVMPVVVLALPEARKLADAIGADDGT